MLFVVDQFAPFSFAIPKDLFHEVTLAATKWCPMSFRIVYGSIVNNPGNSGKYLSKAVKAVGWQLWKRTARKPKKIVLANGRKFVANPDCVVSSALIYADWPEYHELQLLRKYLHQDDFLLDVGANVGHLGLLLSDVVDPNRIVAFEPTPITFRRLNTNCPAVITRKKVQPSVHELLFEMRQGARRQRQQQ